jgi:ATP-dependent DNA helicase RecQ
VLAACRGRRRARHDRTPTTGWSPTSRQLLGRRPLRTLPPTGPLARALRLEVVELPPGGAPGLAGEQWLPRCRLGHRLPLTKRDADLVADWLSGHGIAAEAYSGEVETARRVAVEERLLANELKAVVATSALGMGYDKPDLGFVVHYQAPAP